MSNYGIYVGDFATFSPEEKLNYTVKVALKKVTTDMEQPWFSEPNDYISKEPGDVYKKKIPSVSLRMFNVYGPGQDSKNNFLGMISIFLNMAKKNSEIKVKGSLKRFRDFIYIDDVLDAWHKVINDRKHYHRPYCYRCYGFYSSFKIYKLYR